MILKVVSSSNPNKSYDVDTIALTCTCPSFIIRNKRQSPCKHITQALTNLSKNVNAKIDTNKYINAIFENDDALTFIQKFGEEVLDQLKANREVFEQKGKIKILR
jgi:hypothetical protein